MFHLNFEKIIIHNFMSFGDAEIILDNSSYTLVSGINENPEDNAKSNGSGKSSIWEAISWVLTGDTIRGSKDVKNIHTDDGTYIQIEFKVNDKQYIILRAKDSQEYKTTLKLIIDGKDKSGKGIRDTEKILSEYLPDLTASLIGSVIILGQGLPQRFSNNTPAGRKDVLEKLSKSDFMINDLKDRVSVRRTKLSQELRIKEDLILSDNSKLAVIKSQLIDFKDKLNKLNEIKNIDENISTSENKIYNLKSKINYIQNSVVLNEKLIDEYSQSKIKLIEQKNNEFLEALNSHNTNKDKMQSELNNIKSKILFLTKEIKSIDEIKDVCPTCHQKLPNVIKPDATAQKNDLKILEENRQKVETTIFDLEAEINTVKNFIENKYIDEINKIEVQISNIRNNIEENKTDINSYNVTLEIEQKELQKLQNIKSDLNNQKQQAKSNIENAEKNIQEIEKNILYNNNEKDIIQQHIDIVNKINTLITRDFRGYLLSNVIRFLDQKAKEYSKEVFNTEKLSFELDGNNISISYDNKEYENMSGGEKQKIDIIIQFAIRDMLCQFLNFSSNILVVDEVFDNLDSIGCQKIINLISNKLNDVKNIFIVTHHSDISFPVDKEIVVVKNAEGISRIK